MPPSPASGSLALAASGVCVFLLFSQVSLAAAGTVFNIGATVQGSQDDFGTGADAGNSLGTATLISAGSGAGYLDNADTEDWYKIAVSRGQTVEVSMSPPSDFDFDLGLYDAGGYLVDSSTAWGADSVSARADSDGHFYIRVYRYVGGGVYSMTVDVFTAPPENAENLGPATLTVETTPVPGEVMVVPDSQMYLWDVLSAKEMWEAFSWGTAPQTRTDLDPGNYHVYFLDNYRPDRIAPDVKEVELGAGENRTVRGRYRLPRFYELPRTEDNSATGPDGSRVRAYIPRGPPFTSSNEMPVGEFGHSLHNDDGTFYPGDWLAFRVEIDRTGSYSDRVRVSTRGDDVLATTGEHSFWDKLKSGFTIGPWWKSLPYTFEGSGVKEFGVLPAANPGLYDVDFTLLPAPATIVIHTKGMTNYAQGPTEEEAGGDKYIDGVKRGEHNEEEIEVEQGIHEISFSYTSLNPDRTYKIPPKIRVCVVGGKTYHVDAMYIENVLDDDPWSVCSDCEDPNVFDSIKIPEVTTTLNVCVVPYRPRFTTAPYYYMNWRRPDGGTPARGYETPYVVLARYEGNAYDPDNDELLSLDQRAVVNGINTYEGKRPSTTQARLDVDTVEPYETDPNSYHHTDADVFVDGVKVGRTSYDGGPKDTPGITVWLAPGAHTVSAEPRSDYVVSPPKTWELEAGMDYKILVYYTQGEAKEQYSYPVQSLGTFDSYGSMTKPAYVTARKLQTDDHGRVRRWDYLKGGDFTFDNVALWVNLDNNPPESVDMGNPGGPHFGRFESWGPDSDTTVAGYENIESSGSDYTIEWGNEMYYAPGEIEHWDNAGPKLVTTYFDRKGDCGGSSDMLSGSYEDMEIFMGTPDTDGPKFSMVFGEGLTSPALAPYGTYDDPAYGVIELLDRSIEFDRHNRHARFLFGIDRAPGETGLGDYGYFSGSTLNFDIKLYRWAKPESGPAMAVPTLVGSLVWREIGNIQPVRVVASRLTDEARLAVYGDPENENDCGNPELVLEESSWEVDPGVEFEVEFIPMFHLKEVIENLRENAQYRAEAPPELAGLDEWMIDRLCEDTSIDEEPVQLVSGVGENRFTLRRYSSELFFQVARASGHGRENEENDLVTIPFEPDEDFEIYINLSGDGLAAGVAEDRDEQFTVRIYAPPQAGDVEKVKIRDNSGRTVFYWQAQPGLGWTLENLTGEPGTHFTEPPSTVEIGKWEGGPTRYTVELTNVWGATRVVDLPPVAPYKPHWLTRVTDIFLIMFVLFVASALFSAVARWIHLRRRVWAPYG